MSGKCATTAPTARVILQPNQSRLIGLSRADNGTRTRGLNLGKVALYQLSYVRMCYLHGQQVTKIRQSQEKAKPPRVPPVFQRLSSAEVKFPNYADVPSFMESGTVWASSLNAR